MKTVKKVLQILLCVAMAAVMVVLFASTYTQNHSGRYSAVTTIDDAERDWILARFGVEYDSMEAYIAVVQEYARAHFRYDYEKVVTFQYFAFDDIAHGDRIDGICFDFAVLFKHITLVLDEAGMLPEAGIKVFVTDVAYENFFDPRHSYNVITLPDGTNYYLDLTQTASRAERGLSPAPDYEIFTGSIKEFCSRYKETLLNLH